MPDILLTTFNARYAHAAFGLRYLMANLGPLQSSAAILEFDISQRPIDVLEKILAQQPALVGIGVYIWNVDVSTQLVALLKRVAPSICVVIGGPEVSYETDQQEICRLADYVITGEADLAFAELARQVLSNRRPLLKVIPAGLPAMEDLALPYELYNANDIAHRVIYAEASRGCPFKCEFCLSSLDVPVRNVPGERFFAAMQSLLDRGTRQFKFVDRTFNLSLPHSQAILRFFKERYQPGLFLHFEMIPDRLPDGLRALLAEFPAGAIQLEVGIQSFNETTCALISRKQVISRVEQNLRFLREQTQVHVHADLIVGLPGEDMDSFGRGFDRLVALGPQEIQVGLLKRLRGTPIVRHDAAWEMVYSPDPPYEILQTKLIDFQTMQRLRRFARYWDLIANSGQFVQTTPLIWQVESPFTRFMRLSDWLYAKRPATHGIALQQLAEMLFEFLVNEAGRDAATTAQALWNDYRRAGRSDRPAFLRPWIGDQPVGRTVNESPAARRQDRHRVGREVSQ